MYVEPSSLNRLKSICLLLLPFTEPLQSECSRYGLLLERWKYQAVRMYLYCFAE